MVQFFNLGPTAKGRINEEIGRGAGQGIGAALQEVGEYKRTRGRLQEALGMIENMSPEDKKDPYKVMTSVISATAGIPGSERYVGPLFETLINRAQRESAGKDFPGLTSGPGGGFPSPGAGQQAPMGRPIQPGQGQQTQQQQPVNVLEFAPPSTQMPGQIADPNLQNAPVPMTYSPEQINDLRVRAKQLGYTQEAENNLVNQAQEYNENARRQIQDLKGGYDLQQTLRQDTLLNQQAFKEYIEGETPEFTEPDEKQLALEIGDKYQNEPSMAKRLAKVKQELRPYQQAKKALETTLKRPLFGYTGNQRELARRNAQLMVDKGQKDQLRLIIAKGGHGDVEEADLLNPLPQKVENDLKSIPKFKKPEEMISVTADSPKFEEQRQKAVNYKNSQVASTERYVEEVIQPGTYNKPGTNLLLLRKGLMDKGLPWDEAGLAIQRAVQRKGVELDPHQQTDMQKLGYPPLGGEAYTDNVVQYYLFGKE